MNSKRFLVLAAIAVVAIVLAAVLVLRRAPEPEGSLAGEPLVAGLAADINDVHRIRMVKGGDEPYLTLERGEGGWTIAERDGYPADAAKVRLALINLGESRVLEPKTANPERYAQLGVQDVDQPGATGTRIELDGDGVDARLIVGNRVAQGGEGTYVRHVGQDASVLATGNLVPDPEVGPWLRREIIDIPSSAIREIEITIGTGTPLRVFKDAEGDSNYQVADVPRGRELQSDVVANGLGSMLSALTLDDVQRDRDDAASDAELHRAVYRLFDGRVVTLEGWQEAETPEGSPGRAQARLAVTLDEDAARRKIVADLERERADGAESQAADGDGATSTDTANGDSGAASTSAAAGVDGQTPVADSATAPASGDAADADPTAADGSENGSSIPAGDPAVQEAEIERRMADLRRDVEVLNARLQGWLFQVPAYKFANVTKTLDDMLAPRD